MKAFLIILQFMSRIPINKSFDITDLDMKRALSLLPLVGLVIGGIIYGLGRVIDFLPPNIYSLIILLVWIALSGGLHMDGLADTADGMLSGKDKDKILLIMKDSRLGTFGGLALILVVLAKFVLIAEVDILYALASIVFARIVALLLLGAFSSARQDGLYCYFNSNIPKGYLGLVLLYLIGFVIGFGLSIIIPSLITLALIIALVKHISSKLKGITGDIVGMGIELTETLGILLYYIILSR